MPTKSQLAKLNSLNYNLADGDKKQQKKATKKIGKMGYEIASTSRGITHLKSSGEDDKHHVVVVKGTNPTNKKDLLSDFKLGIGKSGTDKQFKHRQKKVKKIYEGIGDEDKHLTGHSLGGSGVSSMMAKSKSIRENTKTATAFNTGYTKAFDSELKKGLTSVDKKEIKSKLTHHHQKGDVISASLTDTAIGKVKTQKKASSSAHSLTNFYKDKTIPKPESEPASEPNE